MSAPAVDSEATSTREGTWYEQEAWRKLYVTAKAEDQYEMEPSHGSIPADIDGTYFRNGPAKFEVGEDKYMHPFEGDGMVSAVSFKDQRAYFRNRFVRTRGYLSELQAGKRLFRGFSNLPGGFLANVLRVDIKNTANTGVIMWGDKLIAMEEGGLPYKLDPKSLDTLGVTRLGETIDSADNFSAHPRIDAKRQRLVGYGARMNKLKVYEFDKDFKALFRRDINLPNAPGFLFLHDFAITDNYYIFFSAPVDFDVVGFALGKPATEAMSWKGDSRGCTIYVVPRDQSLPIKAIDFEPKYVWHFANAFEDPKTGEVVFDCVDNPRLQMGDGAADKPVWETIDFTTDMGLNSLARYRLDLSANGGKGTVASRQALGDRHCDFTSINPRFSGAEYRYMWSDCGAKPGAPSPGQGVRRVDMSGEEPEDVWLAPGGQTFVGEPVFVPRKGAGQGAGEKDGYIICVTDNVEESRSEVVILDAANLAAGPVCRLPAKGGLLPRGFHGSFSTSAVYTPEQVEKSFALSKLFERKGWNNVKSDWSGLGLNQLMDE